MKKLKLKYLASEYKVKYRLLKKVNIKFIEYKTIKSAFYLI